MAYSLNRVELIGNLGADPEIKDLKSGSKVANFPVATSESWTDKDTGEKTEKTEWHRVVVFGDGLITKFIEPYVKKGAKVVIVGQLRTRKWTDQAGNDKYSTEIVVSGLKGEVGLLSSTNGGTSTPASADSQPGVQDDEIPF